MKQIPQDLNLARGDLMDMEGLLCSGLAAFFTFNGHALYFPTQNPPDAPQFLPRERRLLLPLVWREELLGVLMLHGVRVREVRPLLPALPSVVALCLENLARSRAARTDAVTGLATEDALYARMEDEAARVRAHLDDPAQPDGRPAPLHRLCMGLVVLRLRNGEEMARQIGFAFSEKFLRHVAEACRAGLPSDVLAARVGRYEYALLLSASGRGACHKLARAVLGRMEAVSLPGPLTRQPVRPLLCAGHALYPQDMQGPELVLPMFEQARQLMARARLAADVAAQGRAGPVWAAKAGSCPLPASFRTAAWCWKICLWAVCGSAWAGRPRPVRGCVSRSGPAARGTRPAIKAKSYCCMSGNWMPWLKSCIWRTRP